MIWTLKEAKAQLRDVSVLTLRDVKDSDGKPALAARLYPWGPHNPEVSDLVDLPVAKKLVANGVYFRLAEEGWDYRKYVRATSK